jgi:hypothetical protein
VENCHISLRKCLMIIHVVLLFLHDETFGSFLFSLVQIINRILFGESNILTTS